MLGLCARFTAAPGTAVLCWFFLNGFAIPPAGTLTWAGHRDTAWLACLLTAALVGTSLARLAHARAAYRRLAPGNGRTTTRTTRPNTPDRDTGRHPPARPPSRTRAPRGLGSRPWP
ncbi:hypothetical protein SUDANB51_04305 [Streptomyces sp. enrichment culture]